MIIGMGTDLVNADRIEKLVERFGERFLERCFTRREIEYARQRKTKSSYSMTLAKRYAAKEACAKALGTGFRNGITFQDFEILNNDQGAPALTLTGSAAHILSSLSAGAQTSIHISLSDDAPYALATVIIECI